MSKNSASILLTDLISSAETREVNGYLQVHLDGDWQWLHRVIVKEKMGSDIYEGFEVHHIDGDKQNNHPDNLKVLSKEEHQEIHDRQKGQEKTTDNDVRDYISQRIKKIQSNRQRISGNADQAIGKSKESKLEQSMITKLELLASIRERYARSPFENDFYDEGFGGGVCMRCGGTGYLPEYNHVEGGVCFSCGGSGRS